MRRLGELPRSIEVNGRWYKIRTNLNDISKIITAFSDPELKEEEQKFICLCILYKKFLSIPDSDLNEAFLKAIEFLNCGEKPDTGKKPVPKIMDWVQDEQLLFSSVNKVAGSEIRLRKYVHWWTFYGWLMTIDDGTYKLVLSLRSKKSKGKKLEKSEQEFWNANKDICVIKKRRSAEEQAELDRLNALIG